MATSVATALSCWWARNRSTRRRAAAAGFKLENNLGAGLVGARWSGQQGPGLRQLEGVVLPHECSITVGRIEREATRGSVTEGQEVWYAAQVVVVDIELEVLDQCLCTSWIGG